MKKFVILLITTFICWEFAPAQTALTANEDELLQRAVFYVDHGMEDKAIELYQSLLEKHTDDPLLLYELAYAYDKKGDRKTVLKIFKQMEKNPRLTSELGGQMYQMWGNTLDYMGKRKDAVKKYEKGLKRFPDAAMLYLELGNIKLMEKDILNAIDYYEKAIATQPAYSSGYYRAGNTFLNTNFALWGLLYGEAACLLEPGTERTELMRAQLYETFVRNLEINDTIVNSSLVNMKATDEMLEGRNEFNFIFHAEAALVVGLKEALSKSGSHEVNIAALTEARRYLARYYRNVLQFHYGFSLLDFHNRIIDNGHWEAYNMWLFSEGNKDECAQWLKEGHQSDLEAFSEWFEKNNFVPTKTYSSNRGLITSQPGLKLLDNSSLSSADSCRVHNADIRRYAELWLSMPNDTSDLRDYLNQQVLLWSINTSDCTLILGSALMREITGDDVSQTGNIDLFAAYINAVVLTMLDTGEHEITKEVHVHSLKTVLDYYHRNKDKFTVTLGLQKCLDAEVSDSLDVLFESDYEAMQEEIKANKPEMLKNQ